MPLYSGPPFLSYQWEFLCLPGPVADVEIIEDTLPSLSLSLTWVWIRSSSLDSHGCLIYSECSTWFKSAVATCETQNVSTCAKFFPLEMKPEVLQSAALCTQANNSSIIYLPLTRVEYSLNKIPWSFFSSMNFFDPAFSLCCQSICFCMFVPKKTWQWLWSSVLGCILYLCWKAVALFLLVLFQADFLFLVEFYKLSLL